MVVPSAGWACVDELKPVEVQLPLEGAQSALSKVLWYNLLEELFGLMNSERLTIGHEGNDIRTTGQLGFGQ